MTADVLRTWLQTTAIIVAVLIFLGRELLDAGRRNSSRNRKLNAIKMILARECELNNWTIRSLRMQVEELGTSDNIESYTIKFNTNGQAVLVENGKLGQSSSVVYDAHDKGFKDQLLNAAELDEPLAARLEASLSGIAEVRHVRESLISHVLRESLISREPSKAFFADFSDYGIREIDEAHAAIKALYFQCTGKKLDQHRLR